MSTSKPEAGQWWFPDDVKPGQSAECQSVFVVGYNAGGVLVVQMGARGDLEEWLSMSGWHHEPRCTGWEWVVPVESSPPANQPDPDDECIESFDCANGDHSDACPMASRSRKDNQPDPDEWVEITNPKHVLRRDIDFTNTVMLNIWEPIFAWHGDTIERVHNWGYKNSRFRCRRRDLPPAEKPEQWPKYYAPVNAAYSLIEQKPVAYFRRDDEESGETFHTDGTSYRFDEWKDNLVEVKPITEAEAMALLKKPEPQPAKTRVRLWKNNYGSVMSNDDCEHLEGWQEIHYDAEGFYVLEANH